MRTRRLHMRTSLLPTGCREKQPLSRRAAFAVVNVLIPDFCWIPETVVASEMSYLLAAMETGHYPGRRKPDGPAWGRTGGELARTELWTRPTKRDRRSSCVSGRWAPVSVKRSMRN